MSHSSITVIDDRAPVEPVELTLAERFPTGSIVAWNGAQADGQRRRAVVIAHADDASGLTVLDGTDPVNLTANDLSDAVVLAASVDLYGQRVTNKAKALGKTHGWCDVAEKAITELNTTAPDSDERHAVKFVVTSVKHFVVLPTRDGQTFVNRNYGGDVVQFVTDSTYAFTAQFGEFHYDYFREVGPVDETERHESVTIQVVDEFPTSQRPATDF